MPPLQGGKHPVKAPLVRPVKRSADTFFVGEAGPEDHCTVDILSRGNAFLEAIDRFIDLPHNETVDGKGMVPGGLDIRGSSPYSCIHRRSARSACALAALQSQSAGVVQLLDKFWDGKPFSIS